MAPRNSPSAKDLAEAAGSKSEFLLAMSRSFSGPLPPPELLERYNDALPGAAERIFKMAEKQQEHRQAIEKKVVFGNTSSQTRGNYLGFLVSMTAILGGIWLIYMGKETTGLVAIITPITGLVAAFAYGKYLQRRDLREKEQPFSPPRKR